MALEESREKRKYIRLADLSILLLVIFVAVVSFLFFMSKSNRSDLVAVITADGAVIAQIELSDNMSPREVSVPAKDGEVVVRITDTTAEIVSSPCPDKLCVNTGKLTKSGQSAVCLPERVSVKLVSESPSSNGFDGVAG